MTMYYDAFTAGLVPVRYRSADPSNDHVICVNVTRTHGPYKRGELLVIPRRSLVYVASRRKYSTRVSTVPRADYESAGIEVTEVPHIEGKDVES